MRLRIEATRRRSFSVFPQDIAGIDDEVWAKRPKRGRKPLIFGLFSLKIRGVCLSFRYPIQLRKVFIKICLMPIFEAQKVQNSETRGGGGDFSVRRRPMYGAEIQFWTRLPCSDCAPRGSISLQSAAVQGWGALRATRRETGQKAFVTGEQLGGLLKNGIACPIFVFLSSRREATVQISAE
jgi:hypothetical protein